MRIVLLIFLFFCFSIQAKAQLKYVVEDFEGLADGSSISDIRNNGIFTFGNIKSTIAGNLPVQQTYLGQRSIRLNSEGKLNYGGWGKGIGANIELDPIQDFLNFYVSMPVTNKYNTFKIELQEDDNGDNVYQKDNDDSWIYDQTFASGNPSEGNGNAKVPLEWELISIPLNKFKDANNGGDGIFNISYKQGKLLCFIISFMNQNEGLEDSSPPKQNQSWNFDFVCFSKGELPTGARTMNLPCSSSEDHCNIGTWSIEGNKANFSDIALNFEKTFKPQSEKKLGVIHFFQSFGADGGAKQNQYPSVERVNKVIQDGYIPMITLEDHFVNAKPNTKQPNLYSIIEGHFDPFFKDWAHEIKQVEGIVLLRILHEFNGDWYPWCIVNNDKNPLLLIKAFQHIHNIFNEQNVTNVKFIWCPNSTSFPQEKWNFIMNAYPGDAYVDFIGLDIYNGAGKGIPVWRSFRKEGIENYFILTQQLPGKPLFICEIACRERKNIESKYTQSKAEWIQQMSEAIKTDMSKVRLLTWFNERDYFKINSSIEAQNAFYNYILNDDYFKSGTNYIYPMLRH